VHPLGKDYLKKGSSSDPNNYRGIALVDVLSKNFITIITKRLTFYSEAYNIISECQSGFRAGYSTVDNAFVLYSIVNKNLSRKGRPVYVAFIDFRKAFDSVAHEKLFEVLRKHKVKGNLYNTIIALYNSVKACVKNNEGISDSFPCPVGVRQGCTLSPLLFCLFINELYELFCVNEIKGLQLYPDITEIFMLMFADDIGLVSDTVVGLQKQLNLLHKFCVDFKMLVNLDKTKIVVFKRGGRLSSREVWTYDGTAVETVSGFTYVGMYFTNRLSFYKMAEANSVKGKKVLNYVFMSLKSLGCIPYKTFF